MKQTVTGILKEHGLDFTITKEPLVSKEQSKITPYYGLFNSKTNECINTVKAGYGISQNKDIVQMVLDGIGKSDVAKNLKITHAYALHGGRQVFIQLAIEGVSIVSGDKITRYVTIIDSNDGSTSLSVGIGDVVSRCQNQFFRFYKGSNSKYRHTATIQQKILEIPALVEKALKESMKQMDTYKKFAETKLEAGMIDAMIERVLGNTTGSKENLKPRSLKIMEQLEADIAKELKDCGNTVWGLFNGVTRFTTHSQSKPKRKNGSIESLVKGTAYAKALTAFEFAQELCEQ